jgi:hypothetical protein
MTAQKDGSGKCLEGHVIEGAAERSVAADAKDEREPEESGSGSAEAG